MTHEEGLQKLAELLETRGLRKYLNINNWGYSQIERDIVSIFISTENVTVNQSVFIPKGNAGKGCTGTVDNILNTIPPMYFCKEFYEGLFREEIII